MKIIRTKTPVEIGVRTKKNAIVAVAITEWTWQEKQKRFKALVTDFEVVEIDINDVMVGDPLKFYKPISEKIIIRTEQEINGLFAYLNTSIQVGDNYSEKNRDLIVQGLLIDTQQNPIYNTTAPDWELIDTEMEVKK